MNSQIFYTHININELYQEDSSFTNLKFLIFQHHFYPTAFEGCMGIVCTHGVRLGKAGGWWEQ